jgi:hypothetical protein
LDPVYQPRNLFCGRRKREDKGFLQGIDIKWRSHNNQGLLFLYAKLRGDRSVVRQVSVCFKGGQALPHSHLGSITPPRFFSSNEEQLNRSSRFSSFHLFWPWLWCFSMPPKFTPRLRKQKHRQAQANEQADTNAAQLEPVSKDEKEARRQKLQEELREQHTNVSAKKQKRLDKYIVCEPLAMEEWL